ncbi:hypothetical protein HispidOSU_020802, partial [Sigmodon hispidus]
CREESKEEEIDETNRYEPERSEKQRDAVTMQVLWCGFDRRHDTLPFENGGTEA